MIYLQTGTGVGGYFFYFFMLQFFITQIPTFLFVKKHIEPQRHKMYPSRKQVYIILTPLDPIFI